MFGFNHQDGSYLEVDGAHIYYEIQGNANGYPLIFLHGGLSTIETFNRLVGDLGKSYQLIGIDSRGQGKSTLGQKSLSYKRLQQDVEAIANHLRLEKCSIIGHSDGGIVALRLAAAGIVSIDKMVAIGAHWILKGNDPARDIFKQITAESWKAMLPGSYDNYYRLNPKADFNKLISSVVTMWLDASDDGYPNQSIRKITCELMAVRGDKDSLVSRTYLTELVDQVTHSYLLNIPFTGHSPHEEKPELLMPFLKEFLSH
ncbi:MULTISPECIES: alpha/beta fold hydrolase [Xenorhabdus]|uniref:Hydrolase n=1 Tax=Xenorhabdus ehlersii TaxID=290111 RepID=A0A2D0IS59_9GAMM|nr:MULTISPECIES: alpha/beta hydrolase [Xenorhabdus]MBC8949553.1 hydrolase [Xenorhabdus sp. TS4]PHM24735.1 hydrolase [Xenorhabdus ehlersii]RKE91370.1 pimeloyl-ACP methyl ester carboxylesterase [Xenorhabdus ehlersii]